MRSVASADSSTIRGIYWPCRLGCNSNKIVIALENSHCSKGCLFDEVFVWSRRSGYKRCGGCSEVESENLKLTSHARGRLSKISRPIKVKCQNAGCDARVLADGFAYHTIACEFLEVCSPHKACQHRCQRRLLESHVKQCPQLKVICERECGLVVTQGCLQSHNCVDELKRKLDEAKSECYDWRRKAVDATEALKRLGDTMRLIRDTGRILECSIKDLHEQLDEATRLTSPARQPSPVVQDSTAESSATSIEVLGAGLNNQATRVSEHAVSHFSHNRGLISWPNSFGQTDVEESSLNVP